MARAKAATSKRSNGKRTSAPLPSGYQKRTNEVVAFWDPKHDFESDDPPPTIHFIPRSARAFDNKQEPLKWSVLIQGETVGINTVVSKDGEVTDVPPGTLIGVWYKPGMAPIKTLKDVPVFMFPLEERATGKQNPMIVFDVSSPKNGNPLVIDDDYRKQSLHSNLPFEVKAGAVPSEDAGPSDIPF